MTSWKKAAAGATVVKSLAAALPGLLPRFSRAVSAPATAGAGSASGGVRLMLRLEGLAVLLLALAAYARLDADWGLFAALFLLPDVSFLAYLAGPRVGAAAYNAAHSSVGALVLLALGVLAAMPTALVVALVWLAHIGFDRALGFGLKYATGFELTHLGRVGRADPW